MAFGIADNKLPPCIELYKIPPAPHIINKPPTTPLLTLSSTKDIMYLDW